MADGHRDGGQQRRPGRPRSVTPRLPERVIRALVEGRGPVPVHLRGRALLGEPLLYKGSAMPVAERIALGVEGLLPPGATTIEQQLLLELETVRDSQYAGPVYQAAASFALWRDDLVDARRAVELGWERVRGTEDWVLIARLAATVLEVCAAEVAAAHDRRELARIADARGTARRVLAEAESSVRGAGVAPSLGSRREADARLATARAYLARLDGEDDPATWAAVAATWGALGDRYQVAKARWREAETVLAGADARAGRAAARRPMVEAATMAELNELVNSEVRKIDSITSTHTIIAEKFS